MCERKKKDDEGEPILYVSGHPHHIYRGKGTVFKSEGNDSFKSNKV